MNVYEQKHIADNLSEVYKHLNRIRVGKEKNTILIIAIFVIVVAHFIWHLQ